MKSDTSVRKQKIFVGISGGVDSSVVAYLLKKQGHDVHGIFVKTWSPEWLPCTWVAEKRDAMRVCAALDIPFHFLDSEDEYKKGVADYMISEYRLGRTPNPDVLCNKVIKFGAMWQYAREHGADALATGHYVQTDGVQMMKGIDSAKDQSYFLWMITQSELAHIQFPIGHLQKNEVRKIAEDAGLFTSTKKDSQGICFLGDVDMREFLNHYIEQKHGGVMNQQGEKIGEHDGVWFYTIGERHGFRITVQDTESRPYYVVSKDIDRNILVVSHEQKKAADGIVKKVTLRDTNWLIENVVGKKYQAQIRYHGELLDVEILSDTEVQLSCREELSLGQSLVIYDGEMVVGGAIIDTVA